MSYTPTAAVCVGGPLAGRQIVVPRENRVIEFPHWSPPAEALYDMAARDCNRQNPVPMPAEVHRYRWVRSTWSTPILTVSALAIVHESMTDDEASLAVCGMAIAAILQEASQVTNQSR